MALIKAASAVTALRELFRRLDDEQWQWISEHLSADVQLSDELTSKWLRGPDEVSRYLMAQAGVVTGLSSRVADVEAARVADSRWLLTFSFEQEYSLAGLLQRERLTGSCIIGAREDDWELVMYHLGGSSSNREVDIDLDPVGTPREPSALDEGVEQQADRSAAALGTAIQALRTGRGLSLRRLAELAGLSAGYLSQIENAKAEPSIPSLRDIAAALDVSLVDLLGRIESPEGLIVTRAAAVVPAPHPLDPELRTFAIATPRNSGMAVHVLELAPDKTVSGSDVPAGSDQMLYIESGSLVVARKSQSTVLHAGDVLSLRAGTPVRLRAGLPEGCRLLLMSTSPAGTS